MKRTCLLIICFLAFCRYSEAQLPPQLPEYELKFYDEFDSVFTTMVDTSKWSRIPDWNQSSQPNPQLGQAAPIPVFPHLIPLCGTGPTL
ncbi:MAG: hypothetical protein IPP46_01160 [Bacteroidetes bacterium]|nr:hypothetical protein [Bacteroidota bacterium]